MSRARAVEIAEEELARIGRRIAREGADARWNPSPEDTQRALAKLVLTLVEFLRRLMERQAIRRMEQGTLDEDEIERIGLALMRLEETIAMLCEQFGIDPDELGLDLGPLGKIF